MPSIPPPRPLQPISQQFLMRLLPTRPEVGYGDWNTILERIKFLQTLGIRSFEAGEGTVEVWVRERSGVAVKCGYSVAGGVGIEWEIGGGGDSGS